MILLRIKFGTAEETLEQVLEIEHDADAITKHGGEKQPILNKVDKKKYSKISHHLIGNKSESKQRP